jgi:DnaJ like chaperone protein
VSWWGKLIGGAIGFSLGGPLGALLGAALGHGFDARRGTPALEHAGDAVDAELLPSAFFTATFAVMGHMAKADGRVTRDEIQLANQAMDRMALPQAMRDVARRLFREGKSPGFPLQQVLGQLRRQIRSRDLLRMFLEIQVFAAYVDGDVHPQERRILEQICTQLGFDAATLAQVEQLVSAELSHTFSDGHGGESALASAYAVLGIAPDADDDAVKRAYRRGMSQHHPDKLVARGLPEEMTEMATARTREIRAAYELIRQHRAAR